MPIAYASKGTEAYVGGSTSITINKPAGVNAGDLLVAFVACTQGTTVDTPAGWSLIGDQYSADEYTVRLTAYARIAQAGDPASWTWSNGPSAIYRGIMLRYTGNSIYGYVGSEYTVYQNAGAGSPAVVPAITPQGAAGSLVIAAYSHIHTDTGGSSNYPAGYTGRHAGFGFFQPSLNISDRAISGSIGSANATYGPGSVNAVIARVFYQPQNPAVSGAPSVTSGVTVTTPSFQALIRDWDGGQQIKARFEVYDNAGTTLIGSVDSSFYTAPIVNGTVMATATYGSSLPVGQYKLRVKAIDSDGLESAVTSFVDFQVNVAVTDDLGLVFNVADSAVPVSKDLGLVWDVRQNNVKDLSVPWTTFEQSLKNLALFWGVDTAWIHVDDDIGGTIWVEAVE